MVESFLIWELGSKVSVKAKSLQSQNCPRKSLGHIGDQIILSVSPTQPFFSFPVGTDNGIAHLEIGKIVGPKK
jgi:hypothetical protein